MKICDNQTHLESFGKYMFSRYTEYSAVYMRRYAIYGIYLILIAILYITHMALIMRNSYHLQVGDQIRVEMTVSHSIRVTASQQIIEQDGLRVIDHKSVALDLGDRIVVSGKVTDRVIDGFKTIYVLKYPTIHIIPDYVENRLLFVINPNKIEILVTKLQRALAWKIQRYLPEPHGSLLAGIMLGINASMPNWFYDQLVDTATLHVIAASGYNISVVAGFLVTVLLRFTSRKNALVLSMFGIVGYTLIAGAGPAVLRAAIMGGLTYLGMIWGKQYWATWGLLIAAGIMLVVDPNMIFSVSFWLSVTATGGILGLNVTFDRCLTKLSIDVLQGRATRQRIFLGIESDMLFGIEILRTNLATTLAATVATFPIIVLVFNRLSLVSLLVNTLVLGIVPLIMGLGGVLLLLAWLVPPIAQVFAWLVWLPLEVFIRLVSWFGDLPFASVVVSVPESYWQKLLFVLGYYLLVVVVAFHLKKYATEVYKLHND